MKKPPGSDVKEVILLLGLLVEAQKGRYARVHGLYYPCRDLSFK